MRTFILLISMLAVGMTQQCCVLSGAAAVISDSNILEKFVQADSQESTESSTPLDGVLFDVWEKQGTQQSVMGIYYYDLNAEKIIPVLPEGYALQDVSPNQTWMLANQSENLWLISLDDSTPHLISNSLSPSDEGNSALFIDNDSFVFIQQNDNKIVLTQHDMQSNKEVRWLNENILPIELQSGKDDGIWLRLQRCDQNNMCNSNQERWLIQGNRMHELSVDAEQFWPSLQNNQITYANPSINTDLVYFADTLGFASQQLWLSGSYTLDAIWHYDNRKSPCCACNVILIPTK